MIIKNEIEPNECTNMDEIRKEIDLIDKTIIDILGKRFKYVHAASKYKTSETSVRAPERFEKMLIQRREWAVNQDLNPDIIEKLFRDLINHFISEEMKMWNANKK